MVAKCLVIFFLIGVFFRQSSEQSLQPETQEGKTPSDSASSEDWRSESAVTTTTSATSASTSENALQKEQISINSNHESNPTEKNAFLIKAIEKLQETNSTPDDAKDDFIHFVQTALKKYLGNPQASSNVSSKAPIIIKKLISITPRLRSPHHEETSTEDDSISEISPAPIPHSNLQSFTEGSAGNQYDSTYRDSSLHQPQEQVSYPFTRRRFRYEDNYSQLPRNEEYMYPHAQSPNSQFYTAVPRTRLTFEDHLRHIDPYYNQNRPSGLEGVTRTDLRKDSSKPGYSQRRVPSSKPRRNRPEDGYDAVGSRRQAETAKYSFASDVQDNINGNLHQRQETRDGTKVTGSYTFEDGFFRRTVHYVADEEGYRVVKQEVKEIGDGPLYNPDGSAKVHAYIAGNNLDYRITNRDILGQQMQIQPRTRDFDRDG